MDNRARHPGDPRNTRTAGAASASTAEPSAAPAAAELAPFGFPVAAAFPPPAPFGFGFPVAAAFPPPVPVAGPTVKPPPVPMAGPTVSVSSGGTKDGSDTTGIFSIDGSPMPSRPVSPILISNDGDLCGDDRSSSPSSGSPSRVAAVTKKEEDLPALGQERHIDEPDNFAWLRPLKCVQARGGDDPERSVTNATIVSHPAPAGELLDWESRARGKVHYNENAKWYIKIHWVMSDYSEWLPCEWVQEELNRRGRKRTPRHAIGPVAAAKRNGLLRRSAPQKLGGKLRPIKIDDDGGSGNNTENTRSKRKLASVSRAYSYSRRAAAMSKTGGQKRLKKEKSPHKGNDDLLPDIAVGTNVLKYFTGGCKGKRYYQGKITKLPGPGNSFYHVRYDDGDEEDMTPDEMWMAFSDWCVSIKKISLTKVRWTLVHHCFYHAMSTCMCFQNGSVISQKLVLLPFLCPTHTFHHSLIRTRRWSRSIGPR